MNLSFENSSKQYYIPLKNEMHHKTTLGTDIFGNIQRIDNVLDALASEQDKCKNQLENEIVDGEPEEDRDSEKKEIEQER